MFIKLYCNIRPATCSCNQSVSVITELTSDRTKTDTSSDHTAEPYRVDPITTL